MLSLYPPSSPVRTGFHPVETRKASQTYRDLCARGLPEDMAGEEFLEKYLKGDTLFSEWSPEEATYVSQIQSTEEEKSLYTGDAPLLRLLNSISERRFQSTKVEGTKQDALIFLSTHDGEVCNLFNKQRRQPDIAAFWRMSQEFPEIDCKLEKLLSSQSENLPKTLEATRMRSPGVHLLRVVKSKSLKTRDTSSQTTSSTTSSTTPN